MSFVPFIVDNFAVMNCFAEILRWWVSRSKFGRSWQDPEAATGNKTPGVRHYSCTCAHLVHIGWGTDLYRCSLIQYHITFRHLKLTDYHNCQGVSTSNVQPLTPFNGHFTGNHRSASFPFSHHAVPVWPAAISGMVGSLFAECHSCQLTNSVKAPMLPGLILLWRKEY